METKTISKITKLIRDECKDVPSDIDLKIEKLINTHKQIIAQYQDEKLICIDYDGTYNMAPELFNYFIIKAKELGYKVIACTMRFESEIDDGLRQLNNVVDTLYFSKRLAKKKYLAKLGIHPQIWIDDMPEWIFTDSK